MREFPEPVALVERMDAAQAAGDGDWPATPLSRSDDALTIGTDADSSCLDLPT